MRDGLTSLFTPGSARRGVLSFARIGRGAPFLAAKPLSFALRVISFVRRLPRFAAVAREQNFGFFDFFRCSQAPEDAPILGKNARSCGSSFPAKASKPRASMRNGDGSRFALRCRPLRGAL